MPDRFLAVTIGCGSKFTELAGFAAETCRLRTGLETVVVGEELLQKYDVPSAHWLKCYLFDEFPEADHILYFDADSVFLGEFDFRPMAGDPGLGCVRDLESSAVQDTGVFDVPVDEYFNSGFMLLDRDAHVPMLRRAVEILRTSPERTNFKEQSYLNRARLETGVRARWMDGERFNVVDIRSRPWRDGVVHGHFNGIAAYDAASARALMLDWVLKGYVPEHRLPEPQLGQGNALAHAEAFIEKIGPPPTYSGRGITICAGGAKYFPCAWVCIRMLREMGCTLPVQVWHLGAGEMDDGMRALLEPYGVETVDAYKVRQHHPVRRLAGWELKPYAMIHSPFREVLSLDADNVVVSDPTFLFECGDYLRDGAVFWPDYGRLGPEREVWKVCGVDYRDEPEFETGQILVDKGRCWRELQLTMHYNEHSDLYYGLVHGDKETFHLAWRKLGTPYAMVPAPIENLSNQVMCQHDFEGRRVFQHRNLAKWSLERFNRPIPGFEHEGRCLELLDELRQQWSPGRRTPAKSAEGAGVLIGKTELRERLVAGRWVYERTGYDLRPMTFGPDGSVREGVGKHEQSWKLSSGKAGAELILRSRVNVTCRMSPCSDGTWEGEWLRGERGPVKLRWLEAL